VEASAVKKPPSQRPERQGGKHLLEVGKPYHPDRKMWPQGNQFSYRGRELVLVLFFDQPTPAEVQAVRHGMADFGLYDADDLVVLCYRFHHDQGGVPWSDAPYHIGLVPQGERIIPPDPATLTPESRAVLHIILVNATGGQIRALRQVSLSPEFTARLFGAIRAQASRPFDSRQYGSRLRSLNFQFPTSDLLVAVCSVRCEGGA
jgi:hypothetical protein